MNAIAEQLTPEKTLNDLIAEKKAIKDEMTALNAQLKDLRAQESDVDIALLKKLDAEGLSRTATEVASVSINE